MNSIDRQVLWGGNGRAAGSSPIDALRSEVSSQRTPQTRWRALRERVLSVNCGTWNSLAFFDRGSVLWYKHFASVMAIVRGLWDQEKGVGCGEWPGAGGCRGLASAFGQSVLGLGTGIVMPTLFKCFGFIIMYLLYSNIGSLLSPALLWTRRG